MSVLMRYVVSMALVNLGVPLAQMPIPGIASIPLSS